MLTRLLLALTALFITSLPATAQDEYTISFRNSCSAPILVAIRYVDSEDNWKTGGWFTVEPGESDQLVSTTNSIFYYTANDYGRFWSGDEKHYTVRSEEVPYGFRRVDMQVDSYTDHNVNLSCDDSYEHDPLYMIRITNNCSIPISVYLQYEDMEGDWQADGWYTVKPKTRMRFFKTQASDFYFYAKSEIGSWNGDHPYRLKNGKTYDFNRGSTKSVNGLYCS